MQILCIMTVIIIFIFISIFFFIPLVIDIKVFQYKKRYRISVVFKILFKIIKHKIEIPIVHFTIKDSKLFLFKIQINIKKFSKRDKRQITLQELKKNIERFHSYLHSYFHVSQYILKKFSVHQFVWITELGTGNAAVTGTLSGILWMIKGSILSVIKNNIKAKERTVKIVPHFNNEIFQTTLHCIISIKIGYIIIASIKTFYIFFLKCIKRW